jgi:hypothetical protein
VSLASRSVSLASQPCCRMSLSTSYRSRRPQGSQTTVRTEERTSDRMIPPSRGMMGRVQENEEGTQGYNNFTCRAWTNVPPVYSVQELA